MERGVAPCLCGLAAPFSILRESANTVIHRVISTPRPMDPAPAATSRSDQRKPKKETTRSRKRFSEV
jgi:hypothetical protein